MTLLEILGCVALYFCIGGFFGEIVLFKKPTNPSWALFTTILWPVTIPVFFGAEIAHRLMIK